MKKFTILFMAPILVFIFVGYAWAGGIGIPNPADVYCNELGYEVETVTRKDGNQYSICIFPDSTSCDTWRFLEGKCGEKFSYCAKHGHDLKVKSDGKNSFTKEYAVCVDKKGKEVGSATDLLDYDIKFHGRKVIPLPESGPPKETLQAPTAPGQPPSFDWINYNGHDWMTPVKNQSACGSCWAFGSVGTVEAAYNIHQNAPNLDLDLSEEYVNTDCNGHGQNGCCGGWHDQALAAIRDNGVPDDACMEYDVAGFYASGACSCSPSPCAATCPNGGGGTATCSHLFCTDACADVASRLVYITDFHDAGANNRDLMKQTLIEKGPIVVDLDFGGTFDGNNVFRCGCNGTPCDFTHCVIITGYDDSLGAWHIKNSWGATDGPANDGYRWVGYGECRIEERPHWVEAADIYFPIITVPSDITFDDTCVSDTSYETLNVCNTGMANLLIDSITSSDPQFSVTEPSSGYPVTISPDFCFPFQISFSPTSTGPQTTTLTIQSNDIGHSTIEVEATGRGSQQNIETMIANSGNFGNVCLGTFKDLDLTINNSGGCDLSVSDITSSSPEFVIPNVESYLLVIHPGNSIHVPIRLQPLTLGAKSADITIHSDDPDEQLKVVAVSGTTPPGDIRVTGSTDFGDVCAEEMAEKPVSVCNVGACNLSVVSASIDCADFTLINNPFPAVVSPDSCMDLMIRFTPTSAGPKTCTLTINSDDPDTTVTELTLTGNTPIPSIDVPLDQRFPPTVIQSVGACQSKELFPVSNTGICNLTINSIAITDNPTEYSLSGLPSFPIILEPGHIAGEGALNNVFEPDIVDRDRTGEITVTYISDPITGATTSVQRDLCGEGVMTGARVLVTYNGTPVQMVNQIKILRVVGNRVKKDRVRTVEVARNLNLQSVTQPSPCADYLYHREYGTVSNPIQLLPGNYEMRAMVTIDGKKMKKTVAFDVSTCDFNQNIIIDF